MSPSVMEVIEANEDRRKRVTDLMARLSEAVDLVRLHTGCGDNSCLFERPSGMATNGGCTCLSRDGVKPGTRAALSRLYHVAKAIVAESKR